MKIATLHHIRHFDPRVPPIHSSRLNGKGGLFRIANVLNDVRFVAETAVQYAMLEGMISDTETDQSKLPRYTAREKWDVRFQFWRGVVEEELRYREDAEDVAKVAEETPSSANEPPPESAEPPRPFGESLALYTLPTRQRRYAGLPLVHLDDEEGGFDAVPLPEDPVEAAAVQDKAKALIQAQAQKRAEVEARLAEQRQRSQAQFDQRVSSILHDTKPVENPQFVTQQPVPGFPTSVPSGRIGGRSR